MRERIARAVSALTLGALAVLAIAFARAQNPPPQSVGPTEGAPPALQSEVPPAQDSARGRVVFERAGCVGCHSAAGVGSPRIPLDGVGARRTTAQLRAWTIGAPELADSLSPSAFRTKQGFAKLPAADLDALVAFLGSLDAAR